MTLRRIGTAYGPALRIRVCDGQILELVRPETAFDPESISALSAAFDDAWERLRQSGSECTRPAYARAMREVVAKRIFDLAQRGISDPKELADGAVRFLVANYRHQRRRRLLDNRSRFTESAGEDFGSPVRL
jgi:hypothetical protein